jgi:allophanate hydrolase subunit 2
MEERSRIVFAGGVSVSIEGAASLTAIRLSQNPGQLLEVTRANDGTKFYVAVSQVLYVEPET